MKSVTLAGLSCVIEDDDLVIYDELVGGELTRTSVADAIIAAKWLRVLVEHAAIPGDDE